MTINTREIIEAVSVIADDNNIRVTVKASMGASALVALSTFAGAVVMGPIGIVLGSTAGGLYAYSRAKGTFKSAAIVIRDEMTEEQKNKLCDHVVEAFKNFSAEDVAMIVPLLMANGPLQKIVLQKVVQFITDEMRLQVID